jgi:3-isopropylmalate/(R)-2-methylmalate dehydratase small subunit
VGSLVEKSIIRGRAHVYPRAHINTDEIIPARYLNTHDHAELAKHAMEDIDPAFISRVRSGDILVGGEDFGCGSSREHAVWALRRAGISCVIASNFARIFFRNSLNNGFLSIECAGFADRAKNGDDLEVDLAKGVIRNHTQGTEHTFVPQTAFVQEMIAAGGLLPMVAKKMGKVYNPNIAAARPDVSVAALKPVRISS